MPPKGKQSLCCPHIEKWSKEIQHPFENSNNESKIPTPGSASITSCPTSKAENYGVVDVIIRGTQTGFTQWLYPSGSQNAAQPKTSTFAVETTDGKCNIGPILSPADSAIFGAVGVYAMDDPGASPPTPLRQFNPPAYSAADPSTGLIYDRLVAPFAISTERSDVQMRTSKLGVRVTFTGKLLDTEGWVDVYNPQLWPGSSEYGVAGQSVYLSTMRRDDSFARKYFSSKRTYEFVWTPNCQSLVDTAVDAIIVSSAALRDSRFVIQVGGLQEGDKVQVEWICAQEFTGTPTTSTLTPSPVTHDITHLANAIPKMAATNTYSSPKQAPTLADHTVHSKVEAHPVMKQHLESQGVNTEDPKETARKAPSILSDIAGVLPDILPFMLF